MMMIVEAAQILIHPVVLAVAGYALLVAALAFALQPMRLRMVALAESMLAEEHWNIEQRATINELLDTCTSLSTTLYLPVAIISVMAEDILGNDQKSCPAWFSRLKSDERFRGLSGRYFVSILGANPLAAVLSLGLMALHLALVLLLRSTSVRVAIEKPVMQARTAAAHLQAQAA